MLRKELAAAVGVSRRSLSGWIAEGCPSDSPEAVQLWRENNKLPRPGAKPSSDETSQARLLRAQADKTEADAEARRIKNLQLRGELVERAEIIREFAEFLVAAKPILDAIPDDIATEAPQDMRARMHGIAKAAVDRCLLKLSQWQPSGRVIEDSE